MHWIIDCSHRKYLQCPLISSGIILILPTLHKVLTSKRGPQWSQCSFVEKHFVSTIHLRNKTATGSSSHSVSPLSTTVQCLAHKSCVRDHCGWSSSHTDMLMTVSASQMNLSLVSTQSKYFTNSLFSWKLRL